MPIIVRTVFALLVATILIHGAQAADPATSEAQAIQGDEEKAGTAEKPGPGSSDASDPASESMAIQGEDKSSAPSATGSGSTDASDAASESMAIDGN